MRSALFAVWHVLAAVHACVLSFFLVYHSERAPAWVAWQPHSDNSLVALGATVAGLIPADARDDVHSFLPPGRLWLEGQWPAEYPVAHGDRSAFYAYNPGAYWWLAPTPGLAPPAREPNGVVLGTCRSTRSRT
jgi:hypothetical protein